MAAANYMTEEDTESIWADALDTTRFGKIGIRMAEILNFAVNKNATTQVTNAAITPIMEQLSEEGLYRLIHAAKANGLHDPWEYIQANTVTVMSKLLEENKQIISDLKDVIGNKKYIGYSSLLTPPSHADYD